MNESSARRKAADGRVRVSRRGTGYAAWGADFYVWDEDARDLVRSAAALARAAGAEPVGAPAFRLVAPGDG
jgi:hypothetical protein